MPLAERKSHLTPFVDQEVVAKLAELDMMVADLEHANSRVATVERRNVCVPCVPHRRHAVCLLNERI